MTHKELKAKVSAIMDKEPKHHHIWMGSDIYSNCRKCGEPDGTPKVCIPDPYTIPTERDADREAYDLCLGQALMAYRSLPALLMDEYLCIFGKVYQFNNITLGDDLEQVAVYKEWALEEATPADIWKIVVKAKEQENER